MRPEKCRNCGAGEFTEHEEYYECAYCGTQYPRARQPVTVVKEIHYVPTAQRTNTPSFRSGRKRNKWVALLLCYFLGLFGGHKFYEGKTGEGILYLCTAGLCGIGWLIDLVAILFKPNPYYV